MNWKGFRDFRATIEIDLTKPKEELWNLIDKDAKWRIKKAEKSELNVEIKEDNKSWEEFYTIYKETCKYGGIVPLNFGDIKTGKLFICTYKDKVVAGAVVHIKGEKIVLFLNASHHEFLKFQPNNLLYWTIIKWGNLNNFKIFDLGGYQLNAKEGQKLYDINRFKLRWGGKIKEYPLYSKNPFYILGRKIIRNFPLVKKIRDKLKSFINRKKFND